MSQEQWHAEIVITDTLVKECLQMQFPDLLPIHLKCIGEGWDNKVYLINENIIFRFPRRKIAVELIERENTVLQILQHQFNLEIPNPMFHGKPLPLYPYPFHGYKMIKGIAGCYESLTEEQRIASLPPLADFLKKLHHLDAPQAIKLKPYVFNRTNTPQSVEALQDRLHKIMTRNIVPINKAVFDLEMIAALQIQLPNDKCLIHGDLYSRHLMFQQGHLTGIIDWGDIGINNKSVDLAVIWSFYPQSCHPLFFEHYGAVDAATWLYARFLGIYSSLTVILYADDIGDKPLLYEAINSVKRINPDLVYQKFSDH